MPSAFLLPGVPLKLSPPGTSSRLSAKGRARHAHFKRLVRSSDSSLHVPHFMGVHTGSSSDGTGTLGI